MIFVSRQSKSVGMSNISSLMVIFLLFAYSAQAEQGRKILIVGDNNHPPYSYYEKGHLKGIYYDIIREVLNKMPDYNVELTSVPWKRALKMVELGEADGVFPPHYFPIERRYLIHYSLPVLAEEVSVFCNKHSFEKAGIDIAEVNWPETFDKFIFVRSRGVLMGGELFWKEVHSQNIEVIEVGGAEAAVSMLVVGRADCHINDSFTISWVSQNFDKASGQRVSSSLIKVMTLYESAGRLALNDFEGAEAFISEFNIQLKSLQKEGVLEKIIDAYIH